MPQTLDYNGQFGERLAALKREGRYRVFTELVRPAGEFPRVRWHSESGSRQVVVWCSNDYLGMGHHPSVRRGMRGHRRGRDWRRWHAQYWRHQQPPHRAGTPAC